mgnify:CR=1 FL=1
MIDPSQQPAIDALDAGISATELNPEAQQRKAHVKALFEAIDAAREFDKPARQQYAKDRRYARGDTGFKVDANLIGTFIEILTAFLYARDPDVDVLPSEAAVPPDPEAMWEAAQEAGANPLAPSDPAMQAMTAAIVQQQFQQMQTRYRKRQRDNKAFAETLTIVVSRLWKDAKFKRQAKRWVRSVLTIGVGWIKASWQSRTERDPVMQRQINDLQDNLKRLTAMRAELDDPAACADIDAKKQQYQEALQGLQAKVERVVARGFVADMVPGEDIQVAIDVPTLGEYLDAPWISHRSFPRFEQAMAMFGLSKEELSKATRYTQRKPTIAKSVSPAVAEDVTADEADFYTAGMPQHDAKAGVLGECVRVEELWSRDDNRVYTLIEGLDDYARAPWSPQPTARFYPFFLLATSETDGQRHPQSLTARSYRIVDEYARVRSSYADHRQRTKPKTAFNETLMDAENARKLAGATEQEMVGIRLNAADVPIGNVLQTIAYAQLDPALYETQSLMAELERIWGVQEALSQAIATPKTATEAEIQQTGFQARTGSMRDALEDALSEIASYTAEVALVNMSRADAQHIAGPDAFWPEGVRAEELAMLVNVEIRAGSSGKPNTSAEREAWASLLPLLQQAIQMIGQLRASSPLDMADKFEALLRETAKRAGDRLDIDRLVPQAGASPMLGAMTPGLPGAPMEPAGVPLPPDQDPAGVPPVTDPLTA